MVNLGDKVKDRISRLVGIATGRTEYLYGCVRIIVTPEEVKDGKAVEGGWFDEDQLVVVEAEAVRQPESAATRLGGPMPAPTRTDAPRR